MACNKNPTDIYGCRVRQRCAKLADWKASREGVEADAEALREIGVSQDVSLGTMGYDR